MRKALVTGSSGFVGFWVCKELLNNGFRVIGLDDLDPYYDVNIKVAREKVLEEYAGFSVFRGRLEVEGVLSDLIARETPDLVIHLAAQAGVRHSIDSPRTYLDSNVVGTYELLEACRKYTPKHLMIASTSSAYGSNLEMPYKENLRADHQMSFYAATKKATESFAHSYSHLFNIPTTVFRFFTVYGPWGRPDMALFKFTKAILAGEKFDLYNAGEMTRDFTYVEDLARSIFLLAEQVPARPGGSNSFEHDSLSPVAPWRLVNLGNNERVELLRFVRAIEQATGNIASYNSLPMQPGDVADTLADTSLLQSLTGFKPSTSIEDGVAKFVQWYREYFSI